MNKIVTNLSFIADAAEYFDKKTSAAWKIRSCLTNMLVWSANSLIYAMQSNDKQRIQNQQVVVATLRCWMRDCKDSSFSLDLTESTVGNTLGLNKPVDVHEDAKRIARQKCLQARSALRFEEYYKGALLAAEEQLNRKKSVISDIAAILSDNGFIFNGEFIDGAGYQHLYNEEFVRDEDLYYDATVERQADQLAECVANCLESMYDVCEQEYASAIVANKVNRLQGYKAAIKSMMAIVGVDESKLEKRRQLIEKQIKDQMDLLDHQVVDVNAEIEAKIIALNAPAEPAPAEPAPAEPAPKPKAKVIRTIKAAKASQAA